MSLSPVSLAEAQCVYYPKDYDRSLYFYPNDPGFMACTSSTRNILLPFTIKGPLI
jgi:hypothetical protein